MLEGCLYLACAYHDTLTKYRVICKWTFEFDIMFDVAVFAENTSQSMPICESLSRLVNFVIQTHIQ